MSETIADALLEAAGAAMVTRACGIEPEAFEICSDVSPWLWARIALTVPIAAASVLLWAEFTPRLFEVTIALGFAAFAGWFVYAYGTR